MSSFHSVIYVVGAGRGPLVQRCLNALKRASRNARIYAIEKNANAFVTYVPSIIPAEIP
jgi:protein arginine N-methyltransferase 5